MTRRGRSPGLTSMPEGRGRLNRAGVPMAPKWLRLDLAAAPKLGQ
nr:hypothetical protein [Sphingomonas bacterium]